MTDTRNIGPDSGLFPAEPESDPHPTIEVAAISALPAPDLGAIGAYRLLRKLGEGGMGYVWLAEQTAPVTRQVAVKIIKAGRYDASALKRFELERQSLAIMNHPAIAKVFDAGSTSEGQPYFVMEYVPGLPITTYCDQKRLTTRERLELFIRVCEGVQHAHQKAIMHRDLKPSNILVADVDGHPLPRIIDFGIAKATTPQSPDQTVFTQLGGMLGTPGYISPEQADPAILDVDTRTDVYSLGVILYELLTSSLPFDSNQWHIQPFHEVLRRLREEDPPLPSTRVSNDQQTSTSTAANRSTGPHQLVSQLRGDLDWLTMTMTVQAIRIAKERDRANREAAAAKSVSNFLTGLFKVSDPSEARGNTVTARQILDQGVQQIDSGLATQPEVQARLMETMGEVYWSLGLYREAAPLLDKAVATRTRLLGPDHPDTLASLYMTAKNLNDEGQYAEAEKRLRSVLATQRRVLGPQHLDTVKSMIAIAGVIYEQGRYQEAEKMQRDLLDLQRHLPVRDLQREAMT